MDGVVRTREKSGFTTSGCPEALRATATRTIDVIASENLLRLRLRQTPAHRSGYARSRSRVQPGRTPAGSGYGVQVPAPCDREQQVVRLLGDRVLAPSRGQVHQGVQVGRPGPVQDMVAGVGHLRAVDVEDRVREGRVAVEAEQVAEVGGRAAGVRRVYTSCM